MVGALAGILLVAWLPGALLFRAPVADRPRRAALRPDERFGWAVLISLGWSTLAALALAAVGRYSLPVLLTINGAVCAAMLGIWRGRLRYDTPTGSPGPALLVPVALAAVAWWLYIPASEYIVGGKDPGIYMNQGIQIGQRGTLTITDDTLRTLPPRFRDLFLLGGDADGLNEGLRFMGFFVNDRERGEVVGQFPQGYPIWVAIGYGLDGLSGARNATVVWAWVGLFAVYLLFARLIDPLTAAAGSLLLAVNVAEVWFARYPSSEIMQQALMAGGLLALARALRDGDRFFDIVAAVLFGLLPLVRFDSVVVLAAVGGGVALLALDGARPRALFVVPLAALLATAVPYYGGALRSYTWSPLYQLGGPRGLVAVAITVTGSIAAAAMLPAKARGFVAAVRRWLPWGAGTVVLLLGTYAYWFREPGGRLAVHDAYAMRSLGWYLGTPAIILAVAGLSVTLVTRFWRDPVALSSLTAVAAFILYKVRIVPDHFWQARRYLPAILPLACGMAAAGAFAGWLALRSRTQTQPGRHGTRALTWTALVAGLVVVTWIGSSFLAASRPVARHVEYAGVIPALERLAATFDARDLIVVESRGSSDAHVLATPLAYIYAKPVLLLNTPRPDPERFADFLAWASTAYRRVLFLADGGTALAIPRVAVSPVASVPIEVPEYESLRDTYPRQSRTKKFHLSVFALSPAAAGVAGGVTDLDVGGPDDVWVLRIHGKEQQGPVSYRWTRNVSYVNMMGIPGGSSSVTLWLSNGGRPAAAGAATLRVTLNDVLLGACEVTGTFAPCTLPLPESVSAAAAARTDASVFRLDSPIWVPRKALGVPDDRELGVMLDRIRVQ